MSTTPEQFYATGKRKTAVARVRLKPGNGEFTLNDHTLDEFFGGHEALKMLVRQPFAVTETGKVRRQAKLHGGGVSSQAGALRHRISARCAAWTSSAQRLKKAGFLTRDARIKERKSTARRARAVASSSASVKPLSR